MRAMVLDKPGQPLQLRDVPKPIPGRGQMLVRVSTCAVCRTDFDIVDGELANPKLPLIHDSVFICPSVITMSKLRRCFARDWSVIVPSVKQETHAGSAFMASATPRT